MENLAKLFREHMNGELRQAVLSNARGDSGIKKVKIRPISGADGLYFQIEVFKDQQVFHKNCSEDTAAEQAAEYLGKDLMQFEINTTGRRITGLVSKKGRLTIKQKRLQSPEQPPALSHNRVKHYLLSPDQPVEFLIDLGIMTREGQIKNSRQDKFRQINRYLEFVEDVLPVLPKDEELAIVDFGCGKSYLTFALYYYLTALRGRRVRITGLDLKADVIAKCRRLAGRYGFEGLSFMVGDIKDYQAGAQVDMVISLHACDTATDYALARAVKWGAKVILAVPCCQHELNRQIQNDMLAPLLSHGLLKERIAALLTDGIRAELLEAEGYQTQVMEFIEMEHTPKNILIRAVKTGGGRPDRLSPLLEAFHLKPALAKLLREL